MLSMTSFYKVTIDLQSAYSCTLACPGADYKSQHWASPPSGESDLGHSLAFKFLYLLNQKSK